MLLLMGRYIAEVAPPESIFSFSDAGLAFASARDWAAAGRRRAVVVTGSITLVGEAIAAAEAEGWKPEPSGD